MKASSGLALLAAAACLAPTDSVHAAAPSADDVGKSVRFALQCNALTGSIEGVVVSDIVAGGPNGGVFQVRGTYRQKVGSVNFLHLSSSDTIGGVFEGLYDETSGRLRSLQFKISVRTGAVGANCLR